MSTWDRRSVATRVRCAVGALVLALVFAVATATGALLHVGTPPARRLIVRALNQVLANTLLGTVTIERMDRLGLWGLGGLYAVVRDPQGRLVLSVEDGQVDFSVFAFARSVLFGKGDVVVTADRTRIGHVEFVLAQAEDGALTVAHAFGLRAESAQHPEPADASSHPTRAGRGFSLAFPDVTLASAWAHGQIGSALPVDAGLLGVRASFYIDPRLFLALDVTHVELQSRGPFEHVDPAGVVTGRMRLPLAVTGPPVDALISFKGTILRQETTFSGTLKGENVDGHLDVPWIDPGSLEEAVPSSPLREPGSAHLEVHGTLPTLEARGQVGVGALGFRVSGSAKLSGGLVEGDFRIDNRSGAFRGQSIPPMHSSGHFTEESVSGGIDIEEPGAPAHVAFNLHPLMGPDSPKVLDFDARVDARELARVPRVARNAKGNAHVHVRGRLFPSESRVSANVHVDVDHLEALEDEIRVGSGHLDATVEGPLAKVAVSANVRGGDLTIHGYAFKRFGITTRGSLEGARVALALVGEGTDLHAEGYVRPGKVTTIDNVGLTLRRADVDIVGHAKRLRVGGSATSLDGISVEGLGKDSIVGTVRLSHGALAVKARGGDVDLSRLGRLLDLTDKSPEGHVAFDVDVRSTPRDATGKVTLALDGGKFAGITGVHGKWIASFDGRHLKTELRGALGEAGSATVTTDDAVLGGGLLEPTSWRTATGHLLVDTNIDLARLLKLAPEGSLPFDEAAGRVGLKGQVGRVGAADLPDVDAELTTQGLVLVGRTTKKATRAQGRVVTNSPFQTHGTDVEIAIHVKGRTNDTSLDARAFDAKGTVIQLTAHAAPPVQRVLQDVESGIAELEKVPVQAHVIVPRRAFRDFPEFVRGEIAGVRGALEAVVDVAGTILAPRIDAKARAFDIAPTDAHDAKLVNVDVHATYVDDKASVVMKVARPDAFIAQVEAGADARVADLFRSSTAALAWNAHAKVRFNDFPLDTVPGTVANKIHGTVNGAVTLDGIHQDALLDVNLRVKDLRVGRAAFKDGTLTARADHGTARAAARLNQADGFAEVRFEGGLTWGNKLVPAIDDHRPVTVALNARGFRVAVAQPFLGDVISGLDGRIDGNTKVTYNVDSESAKVTGAVTLHDGAFDFPSAGGSFHAVRARVTMDAQGTVHVDDVSANGATGRLTASAVAKLNGMAFRSASGKLHIARGEKLPVDIQGVPMGTAWGDLSLVAKVSPDGKKITLDVDVPSLHVDLPPSTGHSVQALSPNPDVRVGVQDAKRGFAVVHLAKPEAPRPPSSTSLHLAVHLGKDVWVKRQTMLNIQLHGGPVVDVAAKTRVSGQITSDRGKVEVQSKKFDIDQATVSFVGNDPSNPQISATAHWEAPDKTRVTVQVTGTPEHVNVALHSEPALPRDAIVSLVLFGDAYGAAGASQTGPSGDDEDINQGAGLAGGVVTQGINKAISGVTSVDITTRVDTSEAQNPRPELAVQLTNDVSATVIYNLGLPPPGQNPDRTQIVLDYQFYRGWSLLTTLGDAGSGIADLLWQYRY